MNQDLHHGLLAENSMRGVALGRNYVQFPIMRSVRDVCLLYLLAPTKRCA